MGKPVVFSLLMIGGGIEGAVHYVQCLPRVDSSGAITQQAKQAMGSKSARSTPRWSLLPASSSCLEFLTWFHSEL